MQRVVGLVPFYWLITTVHCKGRSLLSSNNLIEHVINIDMLLVVTISSLFKIKAPVQSCWHVTLFFFAKWRDSVKYFGSSLSDYFNEEIKQAVDVFCKKDVLKISQNSNENTCVWFSFFTCLRPASLL